MSLGKTAASISSVIFMILLYIFTLPTMGWGFMSGILFIALGTIILALNIGMWGFDYLDNPFRATSIVCGIWVIALIVFAFMSANWTNASKVQTQLGDAEVREFGSDIEHIDLTQVPIVDIEYAKKLADKKLGEDSVLGSQVTVGEFTMQNVNGELILVAPLVHSGFFKWNDNKEGTPGYIRISASNPQDVRLIQEIDEKEIFIKYQREAYWGEDLKRHLFSNGYGSTGLTDYSFELDDSGNPYWVITTYENTTSFSNGEATGVIVVDAQTGHLEEYSVQDTPEWVDRIQPMNFIKNQIDNQGEFVKGAFNWSNNSKFQTTEGMSVVYNEGKCYYYTGLTSVGSDDATIGFYLVDTRTKEVIQYKINGAHENAAMRSAEGKVQDFGYTATFPIPVNVNGHPTYFMTLKDAEGLIKSYAFVNIYNYSIAEIADNISQAERNYITQMNSSANNVAFEGETYQKTIEGTIDRIDSKVEGGNTTYIFTIKDSKLLFTSSSILSDELTVTQTGDNVEIVYTDNGNAIVSIKEFDNKEIELYVSEEQETVDERVEDAESVTQSTDNTIEVLDDEELDKEWDSLSEEEKAKILAELE